MDMIGDIAVGALVLVLGIIGLILAAGALDNGIFVFGLALAGLTVLFEFGLIRRHYDRMDAARRQGSPRV